MLSTFKSLKPKREPEVKVKVHKSPPVLTPRNPPSPGMIPEFNYAPELFGSESGSKITTSKAMKSPSSLKTVTSSKSSKGQRVNFKTVSKSLPKNNKKQVPQATKGSSLNRKKSESASSLSNVTKNRKPSPQRRPRTAGDKPDLISESFKDLLMNKYPPYNPDDFLFKDTTQVDHLEKTQKVNVKPDKDLINKIREELDIWTASLSKKEEDEKCPEKWTSVKPECNQMSATEQFQHKSSATKGKMKAKVTRERPAIPASSLNQKPPNSLSFSFLSESRKVGANGPKTPSPLHKPKVLEEADKLLSVAEREFNSAESKLSSHMISSKNSSRTSNAPLSARRTIYNSSVEPAARGSVLTEFSSHSQSRDRYKVPQNSPNKLRESDNYRMNNGEKKATKQKSVPHKDSSKPNLSVISKNRPTSQESQNRPKSRMSVNLPFDMFYEQQFKSYHDPEKNQEVLSSVAWKADTNTLRLKDVETNTDPLVPLENVNILRNTPNSSIINVKSRKSEDEEEISIPKPHLRFNVQKMPSVNIRPEFTIHAGPKINIVASKPTLASPKRRNTEVFDVVYPPRPFRGFETPSDMKVMGNVQFVCDRHVFPSGQLISGNQDSEVKNQKQTEMSVDDKKELLIDLIKSLVEKLERQGLENTRSCCRLSCSLPLLASVVNKVQVDCVKCVKTLGQQLDRLIQLVKEELRSPKDLSEDHCCQLHETVQYQIVELELIQDENSKPRCLPENLRIIKHKDDADSFEQVPKKCVSFESWPLETQKSTVKSVHVVNTKKPETPSSSKSVQKSNMENHRQSLSKVQSMTNEGAKEVPARKTSFRSSSKPNEPPSRKKTINLSKTPSVTNTGKSFISKPSFRTNAAIVEKLMDNLPRKHSKNEATARELVKQSEINVSSSRNQCIEVISNKDTLSEFDMWIQQRSFKIQKIHEELSKLVEESVESYEKAVPYTERLHSRNSETTNKIASKQVDLNRDDTIVGCNSVPDGGEADHSIQEIGNEYPEDFEEDLEDPSEGSAASDDGQSSEPSSKHRDDAEIENGSSSEDENQCMINDNESISSQLYEVTLQVPEKLEMNNEPEIESTAFISDRKNTSKLDKVDMATSPIVVADNNSSKESSLREKSNSTKISIGTSPIKFQENATLLMKTNANVQTEMEKETAVEDRKMKESSDSVTPELLQLSVPSVKLMPQPVENVLKFSMTTSGENSLALETHGSNSPVKFIVQLPGFSTSIRNDHRIIEVDDINLEASKKETNKKVPLQKDHSAASSEKTGTTVKENEFVIPGTSSQHLQTNFTEQNLKNIIEPTVAEVLKKIQHFNSQPHSNFCTAETFNESSKKHFESQAELKKPNVILQTKNCVMKAHEVNPNLTIVDLNSFKHTMDSSNQTEVEKSNVNIQVAENLIGNFSDKATSARIVKPTDTRSYLEMLLPVPPAPEVFQSSESSSCPSSSHSSSSSSSSSKRTGSLIHLDKLSEGEVQPESCQCVVGEVCGICIPRLDLSFGELKTKPKRKKKEILVPSEPSSLYDNKSELTFSNLPQGLNPKPPSSMDIGCALSTQSNEKSVEESLIENKHKHVHYDGKLPVKQENRSFNFKSQTFSDIANLILRDLNLESEIVTNKPPQDNSLVPKISCKTKSSRSVPQSQVDHHSSSDSNISSITSNRSFSKFRSKRPSLVIKSPEEIPKIDAVIENLEGDGEVSISSYQTSVTSVSVENDAVGLTSCSQSSSEL